MSSYKKIPSLYFVATGCLHPEETYDQNIHMFGDLRTRNTIAQYSMEDIIDYLNQDIAWRVSLHSQTGRHLPSLKYVLTGTLHEDEPFDPKIHNSLNRNVRYAAADNIIHYYEFDSFNL